jgi:hypothetical protein
MVMNGILTYQKVGNNRRMYYLCTKLNQINMEQTTLIVPSLNGIESKEDFVNTGRIVPRAVFERQYPKENLHIDTTDVVVYAGDNYIEMLKTKGFMIDNRVYVNLELAEAVLWENIS